MVNDTYGCIPIDLLRAHIMFLNQHTFELDYKYCPFGYVTNYTMFTLVNDKIDNRCGENALDVDEYCLNIDLDVDYNQRKLNVNNTQINLIPKYVYESQISEDLAMDYYDFLYNIGGTVCMWIGVSMLSIYPMLYNCYVILCNLYRIYVSTLIIQCKLKIRLHLSN